MTPIVKLLRAAEWAAFKAEGSFSGSADDVRDGYIHLSPPEQVAATAAKWFAGEVGVVALTIDAEALGDDLRWEPARGGILFPHLYRPLRLDEVVAVSPLPAPSPAPPSPA